MQLQAPPPRKAFSLLTSKSSTGRRVARRRHFLKETSVPPLGLHERRATRSRLAEAGCRRGARLSDHQAGWWQRRENLQLHSLVDDAEGEKVQTLLSKFQMYFSIKSRQFWYFCVFWLKKEEKKKTENVKTLKIWNVSIESQKKKRPDPLKTFPCRIARHVLSPTPKSCWTFCKCNEMESIMSSCLYMHLSSAQLPVRFYVIASTCRVGGCARAVAWIWSSVNGEIITTLFLWCWIYYLQQKTQKTCCAHVEPGSHSLQVRPHVFSMDDMLHCTRCTTEVTNCRYILELTLCVTAI